MTNRCEKCGLVKHFKEAGNMANSSGAYPGQGGSTGDTAAVHRRGRNGAPYPTSRRPGRRLVRPGIGCAFRTELRSNSAMVLGRVESAAWRKD